MFNAINSRNVVGFVAGLAGVAIVGAGLSRACAKPKQVPSTTLQKCQATIISVGKAVVGAPSAAFKGIKNLVSTPPKKPTTTPWLRFAQASLGMGAFIAAATILQGARK